MLLSCISQSSFWCSEVADLSFAGLIHSVALGIPDSARTVWHSVHQQHHMATTKLHLPRSMVFTFWFTIEYLLSYQRRNWS